MQSLLLKIARCEQVDVAANDESHPCHTIVSSQEATKFQLPEPWNGDISKAEVLFVGSNPSYNSAESYPCKKCGDTEIVSFFQNRFSDDYYKKLRYWTIIKKYASWIMDISKDDPQLPEKICITEIVHCKSKSEVGVRKACNYCAQKWFGQILEGFKGNYIVVLGSVAKELVPTISVQKKVLFMPHPNARGITDRARIESIKKQLSNISEK